MNRRTFIRSFFITTSGLLLESPRLFSSETSEKFFKLKVIYNNIGKSKDFSRAWGFSIWIEDSEKALLFDAGGKPAIFEKNLKASGVDLTKLSKVFISHDHWDHIGGLSFILEKTNFLPEVFVPDRSMESLSRKYPKAILKGVDAPIQINPFMWSTGQMKEDSLFSELMEQALIIVRNKSVYLLTGCAHANILKVVKRTRILHPNKDIQLIMGGFHMLKHSPGQIMEISKLFKNSGIKQIAPSHCTGKRAIEFFKQEWGENFIDMNLGDQINIM